MDGIATAGAALGTHQRGEAIPIGTPPRVSVVIPTYNRAASLRRLLRALELAKQPAGGMEIVVVNDGSTDDTMTVLSQAPVLSVSQPNRGRALARQQGLRSSHGEIVVFLDDDVVPKPDAIDRMVRALDTADGVGARILPLDTRPLIAHYMHVDGIVNHYVIAGQALWLITAAAAFRREALERIGGFDPTYKQAGEDVDLTLRLVESGGVIWVEPTAIVYHDHRSRFQELWSTCYRYGRAYRTLASRHAIHRLERRRSARARANPREWWRLYEGYRRQASRLRSLVFLVLHAAVAGPYLVGLLRGERPASGDEPVKDVELVGIPSQGAPAA